MMFVMTSSLYVPVCIYGGVCMLAWQMKQTMFGPNAKPHQGLITTFNLQGIYAMSTYGPKAVMPSILAQTSCRKQSALYSNMLASSASPKKAKCPLLHQLLTRQLCLKQQAKVHSTSSIALKAALLEASSIPLESKVPSTSPIEASLPEASSIPLESKVPSTSSIEASLPKHQAYPKKAKCPLHPQLRQLCLKQQASH